MNSDGYKEVYFYKFCKTCVNYEVNEFEEPCSSCLGEGTNLYSHRPTKYERDEKNSNIWCFAKITTPIMKTKYLYIKGGDCNER